MLLVAWVNASAALPLAGTVIENQAFITYQDEQSSIRATASSNPVRVTISAFEALTLTGDRVTSGGPNNRVTMAHRLTNTGNTLSAYRIDYANQSDDDFNLLTLELHQDVVANGILDSGEPLIANGGTVSLAPGQWMDVVLVGIIPGTIPVGAGAALQAKLTLTATSTLTASAYATNVDMVRVTDQPFLVVGKTVSTTQAKPGQEIVFTLDVTNTGATSALGIPVNINGIEQTRVVLRDALPPLSVLGGSVTSTGPEVLYHSVGSGLHVYTTARPTDVTTIDAIAFAVPQLGGGRLLSASFSVKVKANASGVIRNVAQSYFGNGIDAQLAESNPVQVSVSGASPVIHFFSNPTFSLPTTVARVGAPLFVEATALLCNLSPTVVETRPITISSALTGDKEVYLATETGPDTGIFRVTPHVPTAGVTVVHASNGIIETVKNDSLEAQIDGCGSGASTTHILIDPNGIVFDSRTNSPIQGARVTLIDATTNLPAQVLDFDGITTAPNSVVTGANGFFQFPAIAQGNYRLEIVPPVGYIFPSVVPVGELPADRVIEQTASYGGTFVVSLEGGAVTFDVPLDSKPQASLMLKKESKRSVVELGDVVDYTLTIGNASESPLANVIVHDVLPSGFSYDSKSVRKNGTPIAEPRKHSDGGIAFSIGEIAAKSEVRLTYRLRVGPGALHGDGINRAQVIAGSTRSNVASAKVRVEPGVFSDQAILLGKIFVDCNDNAIQDSGEVGIPGIRLFLEDGTYVVSDEEGKYSIYGVAPRNHVIKVDRTTLPLGAELVVLDNRHGADPGSRFVDVKRGELHKANFAEGSCSDTVLDQVKARRAIAQGLSGELDRSLKVQPAFESTPAAVSDRRALPASGTVVTLDTEGKPTNAIEVGRPTAPDAAQPKRADQQKIERPDMDSLLPQLDSALQFINLKDGEILPYTQTSVQVKGSAGGKLLLRVNDSEIPVSRVGKKSVVATKQLEAWEYVGVDLRPGKNRLVVQEVDGFGNPRGTSSITVIAPGKLDKLEIALPKVGAPADGTTAVPVKVRLLDDQGIPVTVRTPLTLETSLGRFDLVDLNDRESGTQVFVEGGEAVFPLLPPRDAGHADIRVTSGVTSAKAQLDFLPELRSMIATGLVEGVINLRNISTSNLVPAREQDAFEQQLLHFSREDGDGKRDAAVRAALFLKGKVKGEYLLTAAYDSDKDTRERLFRDIQPDEFYPIYGDSAIRGFDAQSTSRLYVRVDKEKSYLLFGDFVTNNNSDTTRLANYSRSLTGVKEHFESDRLAINAYAARDNARQVTEEFCANPTALQTALQCIAGALGTSGPFQLSNSGILINSEKVEILTRDRNQPSIILKTEVQSRFVDYELESFTGRLLFRFPVASLDQDLNPRTIRVIYEVEQGGEKFWVYGADAQLQLSESVQIGATFYKDSNPADPATLTGAAKEIHGVNASVAVTDQATVSAEIVQSKDFSGREGLGERIEIKHKGTALDAQAFWGKTDEEFVNPSSSLSGGKEEAGAKLGFRLNDETRLTAEAIHSKDIKSNEVRNGELVGIERTVGGGVRVELGVRHSETKSASESDGFNSVRAKVTANVPKVENATVFGEYEQAIDDADRKLAAIGGDYQLSSRAKFYGRHEFASTLGGAFTLNSKQSQHTTVFGIDSSYITDGHLFNEYRMRDAIAGRDAEAAVGVRNLWKVTPGLAFNTNFERVHSVGGAAENESLAAAVGMEYSANPRWKGTTRLEYRNGSSADSVLGTLGLGVKLSDDWSVLSKTFYSRTDNDAGGSRMLERLQLGVAYRDTATDRWNGLMRVEHKVERDDLQADQDIERVSEIFSASANYQLKRDLTFSGRYAARWTRDFSDALTTKQNVQLLNGRVTYDLTNRWDLSVNASSLFSRGKRNKEHGLGLEIGYLVTANLWLSGGYNLFGYVDDELTADDYTNRGFFVRLRYKFDEDLFGAADPRKNNTREGVK